MFCEKQRIKIFVISGAVYIGYESAHFDIVLVSKIKKFFECGIKMIIVFQAEVFSSFVFLAVSILILDVSTIEYCLLYLERAV